MEAVDSATPSITPTLIALAPSTLTRKRGRSAWIISEETSMNRLTKPSTQTPQGTAPRPARRSESARAGGFSTDTAPSARAQLRRGLERPPHAWERPGTLDANPKGHDDHGLLRRPRG